MLMLLPTRPRVYPREVQQEPLTDEHDGTDGSGKHAHGVSVVIDRVSGPAMQPNNAG
jgi:hypothetical protein